MPDIRTLILGGGGHTRVIIDCMQGEEVLKFSAILDPNSSLWGQNIQGVPVLGGDELIPELVEKGANRFVVGLGGTSDNQSRRRLFDLARSAGLEPLTLRHPRSFCSPFAQIGEGSVLFPASVVNAGAVIGKNVIVNTGAIVEHDCELGDHVHVATASRLCSTVKVGELAHIGAGATVLQCLSLGEGSVVGIGSAVLHDVAPWTTVVGVPAREIGSANQKAGK